MVDERGAAEGTRGLPETHRSVGAAGIAQVVDAEVRTPWVMLAILALVIVGFSFLTFLQFAANEEAESQRNRIEGLQRFLIAQQTAGEDRLTRALSSVEAIVAAERTVTREIIRSEIQAQPAVTVTKTARATTTTTQTETVIVPPPLFGPSGCVTLPGVKICRTEAGLAALGAGLPAAAFWLVRRSLR